jgi:hypothetical protein
LSLDYVEKLLTRFGLRAEADEVHRVARSKSVADLALRFETANTWALTRAGINHNDWALALVGGHSRRRDDARKIVVDRSGSERPLMLTSWSKRSTVAIGREVISACSLPRSRSNSRKSTLR